jgi:hypothetical protein
VENPYRDPTFTHKSPPKPFYRSNPIIHPFCEHYLMCLAYLVC